MFVRGTNPHEIITIAILLQSSTSKDDDGISSKIIKEIIAEIAEPLSIICKMGNFPINKKICQNSRNI